MLNLKRNTLPLLVALVAATLLAACGTTPTATPEPAPRPTVGAGGVIEGEANVGSIDILILESFPVQVNVVATGTLPDGCTEIDQVLAERKGDTFDVTITTSRPAGAKCTLAIVPFEETIALDVAGLEAGTYTVDVNGVSRTFTLDVDNK